MKIGGTDDTTHFETGSRRDFELNKHQIAGFTQSTFESTYSFHGKMKATLQRQKSFIEQIYITLILKLK